MHDKKWVTFDNGGQTLYGVVHLPVGVKSCPAVVICHGYGGNKCGKHRLYVREAMRLADAGIAVLRFDFRGAGDSDGRFQDTDFDGEVSDILQGIKHLADYDIVDKERIGLLGRSLGGALAVVAASHHENIKSLVLWAPVFGADQWKEDWAQAQNNKESRLLDEGLVAFDGQLTNTRFVQQFFALNIEEHLQKLGHLPMLHFHGISDTKVETHHAEQYERCREEAKAISEFIMLPNSDHDFSDVVDQRRLLNDTCKWFTDTL